MSSSNQRPANRGFRSVFRCGIYHFYQFPCLSAPEPGRSVALANPGRRRFGRDLAGHAKLTDFLEVPLIDMPAKSLSLCPA